MGEAVEECEVEGSEKSGRRDSDSLVSAREHGPAVGATFGDVEFVAGTKEVGHGEVVDVACGSAGESESWECSWCEVTVLKSDEIPRVVEVRYLQPWVMVAVGP